MENNSKPHNPPAKNRTGVAVGGGIVLLIALFVLGLVPKLRANAEVTALAKEQGSEEPEVQLVSPHSASDSDLMLPANIQAVNETAIQARTGGYVSKLYVDIGAHVKKGQVLAEIESPDVDQQVAQANADTAKSRATVGQSMADVARMSAGVVQSRADVARQAANVQQAKSQLESAKSKLTQIQANRASAVAKLSQARQAVEVQKASLAQAQSQYNLASTTVKRYEKLLNQGFVAQQDYDQAAATYQNSAASVNSAKASIQASEAAVQSAQQDVLSSQALVQSAQSDVAASQENVHAVQASYEATRSTVQAAQASVRASQSTVQANQAAVGSSIANARRYEVLRSFERITAPFDGVITSRNADLGALISPGASNEALTNSTTPRIGLFGLASTDVLRVRVNLPQTYYLAAHNGAKATIMIRELPNQEFTGSIYQTAGALDSATRTLLTEIRVQNPKNQILPGMYAQVKITPAKAQSSLRIPANTLMFDSKGTRVLTVGSDNLVHVKSITLGRDFGTEVEVVTGLAATDRLVANPTDELKDGTKVKAGVAH